MSADAAPLGARLTSTGVRVAVHAPLAEQVWLCRFDDGDRETRLPMARAGERWVGELAGAGAGARYGLRADGPYAPERGLWFDPDKLLVDPYARRLDRRFVQDGRLALPRGSGVDTAPLVPKAVVEAGRPPAPPAAPPVFRPGGLIYELNVRGFTLRHPDVPEPLRGTVAALATPAVIAHLQSLSVSAVELMPVVAWIDERHLPPLGLRNTWGYNPVALGALDPGLCPGGREELAATVAALRAAGIGVILDLVFNHTGEADLLGPTLSLRGLDPRAYASPPGRPGELNNDTGCGNTLAVWRPAVRALVLDALRDFAELGVDGFRFDLAPVLARGPEGFDPRAAIFGEIAADPQLHDRVLIAEPWDTGPGGYRLGAFPAPWLEWNDRFRDDVRRFVRGDGPAATLATRLMGSADVFGRAGETATRTINFVAAHDGFTLRDLVSHAHRHNLANGEGGRDGHGGEVSWNGGAEGPSPDPAVGARRGADVRFLLGLLFLSRGTIMLTAGDEFGRTQGGNNNAYAQDDATTWLDWEGRDRALERFTQTLARARADRPEMRWSAFLESAGLAGWSWETPDGRPLDPETWNDPALDGFTFAVRLASDARLRVRVDRRRSKAVVD